MATTYDADLIGTSELFRARYLLGDTGALKDAAGTAVYYLSDAAITGMIAAMGYQEGVAQLADGLITRAGMEPTEYEDDAGLKFKMSDRIPSWERLASKMRGGTIAPGVTPVVVTGPLSGISTGPDMTNWRY